MHPDTTFSLEDTTFSLEALKCGFCSQLFSDPVSLPCGHNFCSFCLEQSLEHSRSCPLCKTIISVGLEFHPNLALQQSLNLLKSLNTENGGLRTELSIQETQRTQQLRTAQAFQNHLKSRIENLSSELETVRDDLVIKSEELRLHEQRIKELEKELHPSLAVSNHSGKFQPHTTLEAMRTEILGYNQKFNQQLEQLTTIHQKQSIEISDFQQCTNVELTRLRTMFEQKLGDLKIQLQQFSQNNREDFTFKSVESEYETNDGECCDDHIDISSPDQEISEEISGKRARLEGSTFQPQKKPNLESSALDLGVSGTSEELSQTPLFKQLFGPVDQVETQPLTSENCQILSTNLPNFDNLTNREIFTQATHYFDDNKLELAFLWFQKAAETGCVDSMAALGFCFLEGFGVDQDYEKGFLWSKKAAHGGNSGAMTNLGRCYCIGLGVEQNQKDAIYWFEKGSDAGDSDSMSNLGDCYYLGQGTKQNFKYAAFYYQKAAELGDEYGMYGLGLCLENGKGLSKDLELAVKWFEKSSIAGYAKAAEKLENYKKHFNIS
ncbi:hypothetical protein P9112_005829 [Eukaryota sp. TZLM1-RC]